MHDDDIVELADGEYSHIDNATYIEAHDEYHDCDSDYICYAEDTERHELTEDCWQCNESDKWFTNDIDYELIDGEKVHPDYVPAQDDEDEVEVVAVTDVTIAADPKPVVVADLFDAGKVTITFE